jgi:hypothetical protein
METEGHAGSPFRDPEDPKFQEPLEPTTTPTTTPTGPSSPPPPPPPPPGYEPPSGGLHRRRFFLDVGRVLSQSFKTYFRNLHWFLLVALLVYSPILICGGIYHSRSHDQVTDMTFGYFIQAADALLLQSILTAALVWWVVEYLRGGRVSIGACLNASLARILPLLGLALLSFVIYAAGFMALFVPGLILMCMFYLAFPALMVERVGVFKALGRSAELTEGSRWPIFGLILIIGIGGFVVAMIFVAPMTAIAIAAKEQPDPALSFWITQVLGLFTRSFGAVVPAVVYQEIRVGRDGADLEHLAAAFE